MHAVILKLALFAFIASPSTLCNGLMRINIGSETDPIVLTCRKVTDFGFCVNTLRSDPRKVGANVDRLAQIVLDLLGAHTKDTLRYLQHLQKPTPGNMKVVVDTCIKSYNLVTNEDVPSAVKFLFRKAYGHARKAASAAMVHGHKCQEVVEKSPPIWQNLVSRNYYTYDLSQLGRDLIRLSRNRSKR